MAKKSIRLQLVFHHHQPVGNFPEALERCCREGYLPLLRAMDRAAPVKFHLSYSSAVLGCLEERVPEYMELLAAMVARGQVEILACAHHEPVLADLEEDDRQAHIAMSLDYWQRRLGVRPRGLWLAEGVWEEGLAGTLNRVGITHTLLAKERFVQAGMPAGRVQGYYVTESQGLTCRVFPIEDGLQRLMPFGRAEEVLQFLRRQAGRGEAVLTFGDQAERWGVWPETAERVLASGYVDELFGALRREAEWVQTGHFSEVLDRTRSSGRCSLPPGVSKDLGMWSLPDEARSAFQEARRNLEVRFDADQFLPYFRVGSWGGFRVRYAEANWMHKTGLWLKRRAVAAGNGEAMGLLREAQCNTAYWYGTSGGLYSPHLREAVWARLLKAHGLMGERWGVEKLDWDGDGADEALVELGTGLAAVVPMGGGLAVWSHPAREVNCLNVVARRRESSHGRADRTIGAVEAEEQETDRGERLAFQDLFLKRMVTAEELSRGAVDQGDFYGRPFRLCEAEAAGAAVSVRLERAAGVMMSALVPVRVSKTFHWTGEPGVVVVRCRLGNEGAVPVRLVHALEASFGLPGSGQLSGVDELVFAGERPWMQTPVKEVWLESPGCGLRVELYAPGAAMAWSYPLTVTQGNGESIVQGTVLVVGKAVEIGPGEVQEWELCSRIVTK